MLTIKITPDNAAFEDIPELECARLLEKAADRLRRGDDDFPLVDLNGNIVGHCTFTR